MPIALWVSLGIIALVGTVVLVFALGLKKGLLSLPSRSTAQGLPGPHWHRREVLPERYAARHVIDPAGSMAVCGLTKTEAEDLLDWLEANGCQHREVVPAGETGFTVRYW